MKKRFEIGILGLFCVLSALRISAFGQTDAFPSQSRGVAGPFGVPRLVLDEWGNLTEPIEVYHDATREIFIAAVTSAGWAQWHAQEFREKETYMVCVYVYNRQTQGTIKEFVYMNTRLNSAVVQEPLLI